jgi:hypothetical protein
MKVPPTNNNEERYSLTSRAALTTLPGTSSREAEEVGNASKPEGQTPHLLPNGVRQAGNSQESQTANAETYAKRNLRRKKPTAKRPEPSKANVAGSGAAVGVAVTEPPERSAT